MPWHPLLIVPATGKVLAVVLSDRFVCLMTHWDAICRTRVPCTLDAACRGCAEGFMKFWYAYAAVWFLPSRSLRLLGIPEAAWKACPDLGPRQAAARGTLLELMRLKPKKNGPLKVNVLPRDNPDTPLPLAWDVHADLLRRFGYDYVDVYQPQPPAWDETGEGAPPAAEGGGA